MYVILVTLLASLISGAATAMPQMRHGQVVITDDPGGEIYAFADRWDQIRAKGCAGQDRRPMLKLLHDGPQQSERVRHAASAV